MNNNIKTNNSRPDNHTGAVFNTPYLPDIIPFDDNQKQWLNGFFSGLHTHLSTQHDQTEHSTTGKPLSIIFGSQTGNAESIAEDIAEQATSYGMTASLQCMDEVNIDELSQTERLLIVTSTYGEGEMPDNAQILWETLSKENAPKFINTYYSVLALGDTNYDGFCTAGKEWDARLESLGGIRIADRVDCDIDYELPSENWINSVLPTISEKGSQSQTANNTISTKKKAKSVYNRKNPLVAKLISKKRLTATTSSKEVFHFEFSLENSGETYNAGDILNIIAQNQPDLVNELLATFSVTGDEPAPGYTDKTLREVLTKELEIRTPNKALVEAIANNNKNSELYAFLTNNDKQALDDFLWGKDIIDLFNHCKTSLSIDEFINLSKPLAPRAYSISSSLKTHNNQVHLTVGSVRYHSNQRNHNGVASTYLADIADENDNILCYFSANKNFSIPADGDLPIIMVGPGTGIAPFRAFLQERQATNAKGENWLFFGDRNIESDFLYQDEITAMQKSGLLTQLSLAFSRDQDKKIYVQTRMLEHGDDIYTWLERGAYFYVCGDAEHMAKSVDAALHKIIEKHGNMNKESAEGYIKNLKQAKRYVRDVY